MPPNSKKGNRTRIPPATVEAVFIEAGYKCGNPTCRMFVILDVHHIVWVAQGGGNEASNLLVLCPTCHTLYHGRHISDEAIRHWKSLLVGLNRAFDHESVEQLLFLDKFPSIELTGDGLLRLAGLLNAGFVEINDFETQSSGQYVSGKYRLCLSPKGKLLVDSWKNGDDHAYRQLISATAIPAQIKAAKQ